MIAILIALGLAAVYFPFIGRGVSWPRTLFKTLPVLCLAAGAWWASGPDLLVVALVFSALGDLALSREGRAAFLYGLAAFALAHLVYVLLFAGLSGRGVIDAIAARPLPALAMLALALSTELWLAPHVGALRWPVSIRLRPCRYRAHSGAGAKYQGFSARRTGWPPFQGRKAPEMQRPPRPSGQADLPPECVASP